MNGLLAMSMHRTERWKLPEWLPPLPRMALQEQQPSIPQNLRHQGAGRSGAPNLQVDLSQRWFGAGVTRAGKTTWAKRLIINLRGLFEAPVYIVDSKGDIKDFGDWSGLVESDDPPRLLRDTRGVQVWRPPTNILGAYDEYFTKLLEARKPAIVLVDELASISQKDGTAVQGFQRLQKQGAGLEICTISLSQEMIGIDRRAPSQMTHFAMFGLDNTNDRRRANVLLGRDKDAPPPKDKHGFWHCRMDERPHRPFYYASWKEFF